MKLKVGILLLLLFANAAESAPAKPSRKPPARPAPKEQLTTASGALNNAGMAALAFSAAQREKDKFDNSDLGKRAVGTRFHIVQSLDDGRDFDGTSTKNAYWEYDKSKEEMSFKIQGTSTILGFYVKFESKKIGQYTGQNAFGAKASIQSYVENEAKLKPINDDDLDSFSTSIPASPDVARRMSRDVFLVIEGVVESDKDGDVTYCWKTNDEATISDPTEVLTHTCYVTGRVTGMAFIDRSNLKYLGEWRPGSTP